jgi:aryl-alcohol dehydrogenase-like predicted oxidoreductase
VRPACADLTLIIDLYQFHVNWYDVERAVEVRETLEDLVNEGKIRWYGWSTDNPEGARVFAQGRHCTAIQQALNVIQDDRGILPVCDEFNLASINRGPLGMGLLTGKYTRDTNWESNDVRTAGWFKEYFLGPIMENLPRIRDVLTSGGRTLAQGALHGCGRAAGTRSRFPAYGLWHRSRRTRRQCSLARSRQIRCSRSQCY